MACTGVNHYHLATDAHAIKRLNNIPLADYCPTVVDTADDRLDASLSSIHTDPQVERNQIWSANANVDDGSTPYVLYFPDTIPAL